MVTLFPLHHLLTLKDLHWVSFPPPPSASFSVIYCCGNDPCTFSFPPFKQIKCGSSPPTIPSSNSLFLSSSQYLIRIWQPPHPHISAAQPLLWKISLFLLPPAPAPVSFSPLIQLVFLELFLITFAMSFLSSIKLLLLSTSNWILQAYVITSYPF